VTSATLSRRISLCFSAKCSASSLTGKTSTLIVHHRTLVVNGAGKTELGAGLGSSDSTITFGPPVLTATVCALLDQSSKERSLAFLSWIGHDIDEQHSETQRCYGVSSLKSWDFFCIFPSIVGSFALLEIYSDHWELVKSTSTFNYSQNYFQPQVPMI
jgi:hypothetical protein